MRVELVNLFIDARPVLKGSVYDVAARLLKDPAAHFASEVPSVESARDLLPTLRARAVNAHRRGTRVFGLASLIKQLAKMPHQTQILGYGVVSPGAAGNLYFLAQDRKPLGATIVELGP